MTKLKGLAIQLRLAHQIPFKLAHLIYKLKDTDDLKYVLLLKELSEETMRVRGYYLEHKDIELQMNDAIDKALAIYNQNKDTK